MQIAWKSAMQSGADILIYKVTTVRNNSHENAAYHKTNHSDVIQFGFPVFFDQRFFI